MPVLSPLFRSQRELHNINGKSRDFSQNLSILAFRAFVPGSSKIGLTLG
jgi:hypothetical protein